MFILRPFVFETMGLKHNPLGNFNRILLSIDESNFRESTITSDATINNE